MRTVGELVRGRFRALGLNVRKFADLVGVERSLVSKYLRGERPTPAEHVERWTAVLQLNGEQAAELRTAIHVSSASPYVGEIVAQLQRDLAGARRLISFYEQHNATMRTLVEDLTRLRGLSDVPSAPAHPDDPDQAPSPRR